MIYVDVKFGCASWLARGMLAKEGNFVGSWKVATVSMVVRLGFEVYNL
jgi:hypothetical protein